MRKLSFAAMLVAFAAIATPAFAGHVLVANTWFRALPVGLPDAGYFDVRNVGDGPISLTAADSPACGMLMLHKSEDSNGTGSMQEVARVDIPAGVTVHFAPGGYHLMCTDPGPTMRPGNTVAVTLTFSDGTVGKVTFPVKNARGE